MRVHAAIVVVLLAAMAGNIYATSRPVDSETGMQGRALQQAIEAAVTEAFLINQVQFSRGMADSMTASDEAGDFTPMVDKSKEFTLFGIFPADFTNALWARLTKPSIKQDYRLSTYWFKLN